MKMTTLNPRIKSIVMKVLVTGGFISLVYYFSWWFTPARLSNPLLTVVLVVAVVCALPQLAGSWLLYLKVRPMRERPRMSYRYSVDVFITAYKEDLQLVRKAVAAAVAMRGEHKTWLLDDGKDPALKELAGQLGVGYLTRDTQKDAKAGNVNAALKQTSGDIVVIFDIDHIPHPTFLEHTLPFFLDPGIAFVQMKLNFYNGDQSWVAHAASESSLDYYNSACRGSDGLNSAMLTGSNALLRRAALVSIGGYQPGLAEDLATSLALHAAGWRSIYIPESLAPGLAPHDLAGWYTQQLKWARGVFELLLTSFLRLFWKLTKGQKVAYAVRMTYYWIGPVIMAHLVGVILASISDDPMVKLEFSSYLLHLLPTAGMALLIRQAALLLYRLPENPNEKLVLWRATLLVFGSWPVYTAAWLMAVLRMPLRFRPTPKGPVRRVHFLWLAPQLVTAVGLAWGAGNTLAFHSVGGFLLAAFALLLAAAQLPVLLLWSFPAAERPLMVERSEVN